MINELARFIGEWEQGPHPFNIFATRTSNELPTKAMREQHGGLLTNLCWYHIILHLLPQWMIYQVAFAIIIYFLFTGQVHCSAHSTLDPLIDWLTDWRLMKNERRSGINREHNKIKFSRSFRYFNCPRQQPLISSSSQLHRNLCFIIYDKHPPLVQNVLKWWRRELSFAPWFCAFLVCVAHDLPAKENMRIPTQVVDVG